MEIEIGTDSARRGDDGTIERRYFGGCHTVYISSKLRFIGTPRVPSPTPLAALPLHHDRHRHGAYNNIIYYSWWMAEPEPYFFGTPLFRNGVQSLTAVREIDPSALYYKYIRSVSVISTENSITGH